VKLLEVVCFRHGMSCQAGGARMFGIGRPENGRSARGHQRCDQRQQDLGAWRGDDMGGGGRPIGPRGDPREPHLRLAIGQARERTGGKGRQRIGMGIDSG